MSWFSFAPEELEDEGRKKLIIELHGGSNITDPKTKRRPDGPEVMDLYCIVSLGKQKYQTEIIPKNLNPVWANRFEFDIEDCEASAIVEVACYQSGIVTDSLMGEVRIPVAEHKDVAFEFSVQHWFPLYNSKLKKQDGSPGELAIKVGASGGDVSFPDINRMKALLTKYFKQMNLSQIQKNNNTSIENHCGTAEDIYQEANMEALAANAASRRCVKMAEQTREIQVNTMMKLREQGNQIERIQGGVETINSCMKQSERKLRGIESVWGSIANKMSSSKVSNKRRVSQEKKLSKKRERQTAETQRIKQDRWENKKSERDFGRKKRDEMIQPVNRNAIVPGSQEEQFFKIVDNTDDQLNVLSHILDDIKMVSLDMGDELSIQTERLNDLDFQVRKALPRMENATRRARVLLA